MSWLTVARNFIFSGVFTQAARAASSSSPTQAAAGNAALAAISTGPAAATAKAVAISTLGTVAQDVASGIAAHNSPVGITNAIVGDLEDGLKGIVDGFVTTMASGVPLVGGLIAPEAVNVVNMGLDFAEQHALTYVAGLFAHHKAAAAASVAPASAAGSGTVGTGGSLQQS